MSDAALAGRAAPRGADDAKPTARQADVGAGLRGDGARSAPPPSVLSPRPLRALLGSSGGHFRDREWAHDCDRPAGGGPRPGAGDTQRRRADRQRRTTLTRRIQGCPHSSAGNSTRAFSAPDRVAAGASRNLRPASRQWLPDAAAAQVLRISAMPLEDRELRTSGNVPPPPPGSLEMGSAAVAALPED